MPPARLILICALCVLPLPAMAEELLPLATQLIEQGQASKAVTLFEEAAAAGDPDAEYGLGVFYYEGTGVEKDLEKSFQHFLKAAEAGHVQAQFNLGNAYLNGRGVTTDLNQAEHWWRRAAASGYVRAQYNLGTLLLEHAVQPEGREEGIAWLRVCAQQGFARAAERLQAIEEPLVVKYNEANPQSSILRSEARLLTLPPGGYTIQLSSAREAHSAEGFIRQNALQDDALRYRYLRKSALWTGVVYGLYRSQDEALQAIADLAEPLRQAGPWPKPLADIQQLIRTGWRARSAP